jgi:hypothetical protein
MKGFILGFLLASALGASWVYAQQSGYITDQYGNHLGNIYQPPSTPMPDYMAPSRQMQQQLQGILGQRNPC